MSGGDLPAQLEARHRYGTTIGWGSLGLRSEEGDLERPSLRRGELVAVLGERIGQEVGEVGEGVGHLGFESSGPPDRRGRRCGIVEHCREQRGLADSGRAVDHHDRGVRVQERAELSDLRVTSDDVPALAHRCDARKP